MITIHGAWMDGKTSRRESARMLVDRGGRVEVRSDHGALLYSGLLSSVGVPSRLGNTPRLLRFEAGQTFETSDQDGVDAAARLGGGGARNILHALESRWRHVLVSVLIVCLLGASFIVWGVPASARWIAFQLPQSVADNASKQTLAAMDQALFKASSLDEEVKGQVLQHLQPAMDEHAGLSIRLLFRDSPRIGANAFALPDGTIIFTDDLVELAEHPDELLAIFAHEIGHVAHRHGLRLVIQDSLVAFAIVLVVGDPAASAELLLLLPVALTQMAYSRDAEREADDYAYDYLTRAGVDVKHFANLMRRMQTVHGVDKDRDGDKGWLDYLSTHPATDERLEQFEQGRE